MSIRKRGKIWYCYYRIVARKNNGEPYIKQIAEPVGTDYQAALFFDAHKKAETFAEKHGKIKPAMNIDDFFEKYCVEYSNGKKKPTTIIRDKLTWRIFKRICPEVRTTKDFTDDALINFKVRRLTSHAKKANIKRASVNREIGMLKNLAKWGYKHRYLDANYYDLVEKYNESDSVKRPAFTDEQLKLLIDNSNFPCRAAYILGAWQGMRRSEICFLEHSDFNWEENTIEIKSKPHLGWSPKTKTSERIMPIHPYIINEIKQYWNEGKNKSTFFLCKADGKQLQPRELTTETRKLCRKLGIPEELSLHSTRHTFATRIQEGGAPLRKVSKLLGHANTQITEQQYTHFKETEHFDAINNLKIDVELKQKD